MNAIICTRLLLLSIAVALASLADVAAPAAVASPPPQIYVLGGPGEVTIQSNNSFTPGATVGITVFNSAGTPMGTWYTPVNQCGAIEGDRWPTTCSDPSPNLDINLDTYVGDIQVRAEQLAPAPWIGTLVVTTHIGPMLWLDATAGGSGSVNCRDRPVHVSGSNFHKNTPVRLELTDFSSSFGVMDSEWTTSDSNGNLPSTAVLQVPAGYLGTATVWADEQFPYGQTQVTSVYICF